jgi:effector-binding domain-containing protein
VENEISLHNVAPRRIAVVRARLPLTELGQRLLPLVHRVYTAVHTGNMPNGGHHVIVYRGADAPDLALEVGIEVAEPFEHVRDLVCSQMPRGEVAMTVHWGAYQHLPEAHQAVIRWCQANERLRAGPRWEVYSDWHDDPELLRTEVCSLLGTQAQGEGLHMERRR